MSNNTSNQSAFIQFVDHWHNRLCYPLLSTIINGCAAAETVYWVLWDQFGGFTPEKESRSGRALLRRPVAFLAHVQPKPPHLSQLLSCQSCSLSNCLSPCSTVSLVMCSVKGKHRLRHLKVIPSRLQKFQSVDLELCWLESQTHGISRNPVCSEPIQLHSSFNIEKLCRFRLRLNKNWSIKRNQSWCCCCLLIFFFLSLFSKTQPNHWTKQIYYNFFGIWQCLLIVKVGLGISRTNADSQWNPVYNVFHRSFCCGNETIRR